MCPNSKKTRVLSFINEKGGVGKTTTAVNVAYSLAKKGKKILFIDLDPTANASICFGVPNSLLRKSSYDIFLNNFDTSIIHYENLLNIITGDDRLAGLDSELASKIGREKILKKFIVNLHNWKFDFIILDCGGSLNILSVNTIVASTDIVIVMQTEHLSLEGVPKLLKTINSIRVALDEAPNILGILPTIYDVRLKTHRNTLNKLLDSSLKTKVFKNLIRKNIDLALSNDYGQPILKIRPLSIGAKDYENFTLELLEKIEERR